jgi:hypothetical protein
MPRISPCINNFKFSNIENCKLIQWNVEERCIGLLRPHNPGLQNSKNMCVLYDGKKQEIRSSAGPFWMSWMWKQVGDGTEKWQKE